MSEFMLVFRGGGMPDNPTPEQIQAHIGRWAAWMGHLAQSSVLRDGKPLADGGRTITGAEKTVTDGPYAEAKDLVGGYVIVGTPDYEGAVELALGCPVLEDGGSVEVRECQQMVPLD